MEIDPTAIRVQVERILGSRYFSGVQRLSEFLRFVVERTLAEREAEIKEYLVAVEVYRRDSSFDPKLDSTIRVEASKLRARLNEYYENEGGADPILITIPKGRYVPRFETRSVPPPPVLAGLRESGIGLKRVSSIWLLVVVLVAVALGATWWIIGRSGQASAPAPAITRITSDVGLTAYPALSPDGSLLAYASDRDGDGDLELWVQPVAGRDPIRLTRSEADETEPVFSPDGSRIAFRSSRDGGGIYLVPALGGTERLLAAGGNHARFSPDGRWLAYSVTNTRFYATSPGSGSAWVVSVDGGPPRRIAPGFASAHYPVWAPDGKHLLLLGRSDAGRPADETMDWWVVPVDGGVPVRTNAHPELRKLRLGGPTWPYWGALVPELWLGEHVFFSAGAQHTSNLWRIRIAPGTWRVDSPPERLTFGSGLETQPSIALGRVVFASVALNQEVWSLPIDVDAGRIKAPVERLTRNAATDNWPSLSEDGRTLVFYSDRSGNGDIWLKNLETGLERALTSTQATEDWPEIAPDGRSFSYHVRVNNRKVAYRRSIDGADPEKVCEICDYMGRTRDGAWDLYTDIRLEPYGIRMRSRSLGTERAFLNHPKAGLFQALLSPDDRWIVFSAHFSATDRRIFIVPFPEGAGSSERDWIPLTGGGCEDIAPHWSTDGNSVYYVSWSDGFSCLKLQRLDPMTKRPTEAAATVAHFHAASRRLGNVGVSQRGLAVAAGRIAFPVQEITGNVWSFMTRTR